MIQASSILVFLLFQVEHSLGPHQDTMWKVAHGNKFYLLYFKITLLLKTIGYKF